MVKLLLAVVLMAGCLDTRWEMPAAHVVAVADDSSHAAEWTTAVAAAVDEWNTLLAARGCAAPFVVSSSGHEIRLVARAAWSDDSAVGLEDADSILIRSSSDNGVPVGTTLQHELGHAMGLEHANPADGPSVMLPHGGPDIQPRDVDAAAKELGCGQ